MKPEKWNYLTIVDTRVVSTGSEDAHRNAHRMLMILPPHLSRFHLVCPLPPLEATQVLFQLLSKTSTLVVARC